MNLTFNIAIDFVDLSVDPKDNVLIDTGKEDIKVDVHTLVDGKLRENFSVQTLVTRKFDDFWNDLGAKIVKHMEESDLYSEFGS
jgi:hypothetical protein